MPSSKSISLEDIERDKHACSVWLSEQSCFTPLKTTGGHIVEAIPSSARGAIADFWSDM